MHKKYILSESVWVILMDDQGRRQKKISGEANISGPPKDRIGMQGMWSIAIAEKWSDQARCKYWPYSTVLSLMIAVIYYLKY